MQVVSEYVQQVGAVGRSSERALCPARTMSRERSRHRYSTRRWVRAYSGYEAEEEALLFVPLLEELPDDAADPALLDPAPDDPSLADPPPDADAPAFPAAARESVR